ncbi:transposase [Nocardioides sp. LHG3406-4]|uniref:transposase n=1 Tax=Nocardioides sp. LHG3406-4 TaxID=2804575 RepID=UPI003CE970B0
MPYPSDLTDEQWNLLEPVFNAPGKRGRRHADDLRTVVDAMQYVAQTGCQWRYLPESFGPWTRVWSQFRRWSRNGTWAQALTVLHAAARRRDGRTEETPSRGRHRHPPGPRRLERWVHVPRPRRPLWADQGREACSRSRRDGPSRGCTGRSCFHARATEPPST